VLPRGRENYLRRVGVSTRTGRGTSQKQVPAAIIEDQKATHRRAGMTMFSSLSLLRIGQSEHRKTTPRNKRFGDIAVPKLMRDKHA
jgi:hypothetical protein